MIKWVFTQMLLVSILLCGCNKMTEEELASYEARHYHEYDVVSVHQYIKTETNAFGGVISQEPKYSFTYIGDDDWMEKQRND